MLAWLELLARAVEASPKVKPGGDNAKSSIGIEAGWSQQNDIWHLTTNSIHYNFRIIVQGFEIIVKLFVSFQYYEIIVKWTYSQKAIGTLTGSWASCRVSCGLANVSAVPCIERSGGNQSTREQRALNELLWSYIHMCVSIYLSMYVCIYIYREREIDR